ncbi:hypothetical protein BCR42DRAFT_402335 [Absidia repens]|uniref:Uncharacterized protein n=1 Tax=Absidia repens TaxID=90262 RepID=A0A1X2IXY3_9FUNG|nr:hypothetical protein BCR42DRAFT_402335 [Absidia repens]
MSSLNENVQSAIDATVASSSIDACAIIENLLNQKAQPEELTSVASTAADIPAPVPVVENVASTDKAEKESPVIASTATVQEAIEEAEKEAEQEQEETVPASTAIGIPAPTPIIDAVAETKEEVAVDEVKEETEEEVAPLSETLQKAVDSVATAPIAAIQQVIKDVTPESDVASSSAPVLPSTEQQQQRATEIVQPSALTNEAVQAAIASVVASGAMDVSAYAKSTVVNDVEEPKVEEPKVEEIISTDDIKEQEPIVEEPAAPVIAVCPAKVEELKVEDQTPAEHVNVKEVEAVVVEQVKQEQSVEPIKEQLAATNDIKVETPAIVEQVKDEQTTTSTSDIKLDNEPTVEQSTPITSVDTKTEEKPEIVNTVPQSQESQHAPTMEAIQKPEPIVPVPLESSEVNSQLPAAAPKSLPPQPAQPQVPAAPSAPAVSQEEPAKSASEAKSSRCTIM